MTNQTTPVGGEQSPKRMLQVKDVKEALKLDFPDVVGKHNGSFLVTKTIPERVGGGGLRDLEQLIGLNIRRMGKLQHLNVGVEVLERNVRHVLENGHVKETEVAILFTLRELTRQRKNTKVKAA